MVGWLKVVGSLALAGAKKVVRGKGALDVAEAFARSKGVPDGLMDAIDTLEEIADDIVKVEIVGQSSGLSGQQKAEAAAKLVAQALLKSKILGGHAPADEATFLRGCQSIASGVADVLNSRQVPEE